MMAATAAFLGGSSRADAAQIVVLRPLFALFLVPALYLATRDRLAIATTPVLLIAALAVWMALQLVPLPPQLWHLLPGRELVVALDRAVGLEENWRPISLVPTRSWNALFSLIVPIAGLLAALAMRSQAMLILLVIACMALCDALLGIMQTIGGASDALYFYTYTNKGAPVGIFANQNHSAVFSACSLPILARLIAEARGRGEPRWLKPALAVAAFPIVLAILISGSRAGLLCGLFALLCSAYMVWSAQCRKRVGREGAATSPSAASALAGKLAAPIALATLLAGVWLFYSLDKVPALAFAVDDSEFDGLRSAILPSLGRMVADFWLLGTGFGSFEEVYHIFEPDELMFPWYVNQAHNDWAQFLIEGGVPAVAIVVALAWWIVASLRKVTAGGPGAERLPFWFALIAIILAASLVDYPLRAPSFQLVAVWLLVVLALDARSARAR